MADNGGDAVANENGGSGAAPAPALPDYLASPNAVFTDEGVEWRYGKAPDYSKTRKVWEEGKQMNHVAGSLPQLVENLVKNWEVEASFKTRLSDWRTIDHENYSFAVNGGPPQNAEHMLKVGTYNAILAPSEYYSPNNSDFNSSHKTFKRMMPTFAWEVLEVYSGPPRVAFRWRHWGTMKNDYVGFNDKGEKITAKAHGGQIDIQGVTIANVDDKVRLQSVDTYMDSLEMFRQIAPHGIVNRAPIDHRVPKADALDAEPAESDAQMPQKHSPEVEQPVGVEGTVQKHISESTGQPADAFVPHQGADTSKAAETSDGVDSIAMPAKTAESGDASTSDTSTSAAQSEAQTVVEAAAAHGAAMEIGQPASNAAESTQTTNAGTDETSSDQIEQKSDGNNDTGSIYSSSITGNKEDILTAAKSNETIDESVATGTYDALDKHLEQPAAEVHSHPRDVEDKVHPAAGDAVAAGADSVETRMTHGEMSSMTPAECPFLQNRE